MMLMRTLLIISIQVSGFIRKEKKTDSSFEKMFTTSYKIPIKETIAKVIKLTSNIIDTTT